MFLCVGISCFFANKSHFFTYQFSGVARFHEKMPEKLLSQEQKSSIMESSLLSLQAKTRESIKNQSISAENRQNTISNRRRRIMTIRTLKITFFASLCLLMAGTEFAFAQGRPSRAGGNYTGGNQNVARPGQGMSYDQAMDRRFSVERYRQEERDIERERWEANNRRQQSEQDAWLTKMRNRPCTDRRTDAGFQSPTELNKRLEQLRSGDAIELHGDLFTAFDGTILSATYYRGAKGKDSVPVVLLHGRGGSRRDFDPIIPALLKEGMAVLVPDIRGHGKSIECIIQEFGEPDFFEIPMELIPENPFLNTTWLPTRWANYERLSQDLAAGNYEKPATKVAVKKYDRFEDRDISQMVFDLQVWQNFLVNENNNERLNLKKMNLVGVEMGAGLATAWARNDLAPADGKAALKQTKTLTLISPVISKDAMEAKKGNGFPLVYMNSNAMRNSLSTMIIVGKANARALQDAEEVKKVLAKGTTDNEPGLKAKYPLIQSNTEKQGRDLVAMTSTGINEGIPKFIKTRLATLEANAAEKSNDKTLTWVKYRWNVRK